MRSFPPLALAALITLTAGCARDKVDKRDTKGESEIPLCDISALPGALDDERCMARITSRNLRYMHGVLAARLENLDAPGADLLRRRHTEWKLAFEAREAEVEHAALELYELALAIAVAQRGGWRSERTIARALPAERPESEDSGHKPAKKTAKKPADKDESTSASIEVPPVPDKKSKGKLVAEYQQLFNRVGKRLQEAKLDKNDRLTKTYLSLSYKAGLKNLKVRHSYIATLKTIERQLKARGK